MVRHPTVRRTNEGIWVLDEHARVEFVNRRMAEMLGYEPHEVVGRPKWDFLFEEDRAEAEVQFEQRLGLRNQADVRFRRRDGTELWALMAAGSLIDEAGAFRGALDLFTDITERKDAEAQVRRLNETLEQRVAERTTELALAEERFRGAFDAAPIGMALVAPNGRWLRVNDATCRIVGYSKDELLGMTFQDITHPDDLGVDLGQVRRMLAGEVPAYQMEKRYVHKYGHVVWAVLSVSLVRDDAGRPLHFVSQIQDVTARKQFEEQLQSARDEAVNAARAKSEFLANMSHEIRTPMNGVIGMTELLLDTQLNDLQRDYAETIRNSGEALLTIINDILDFSKIEAGKMTIKVSEFDPRTLLEEVTDLLAPRAQQKGLELNSRVDPRVPGRLKGNPVRIRQVLTNLAGNAVKFTDRGEVYIEARVVSQDEVEATLRVLVRDTGIGIPADRQADIFESFTQIEGGNSRRFGGTGLGLSICRSLVAMMGGRIGLESTPGVGSTFWFELTLGKGAGGADLPAAHLEGLRVLVIDDNATNRQIVSETLISWGCRPEAVGSGADGFARLLAAPEGDPFALVLLDHHMPGMDGEQTAKVIKSLPRFAGLPIVLLTSCATPGAGREVEEGLFVAKLTKPVGRSPLYNVIFLAAGTSGPSRARPRAADAEEPAASLGLRVLLAEDNDVNRRVAAGMAERLGCRVDAVRNGREALEVLDLDLHDLILMDVQMPEMDGLRATAAIRGRERGTGRHVPIIALTAHAMQGDREKCLAAGMDGYLTKPLRAGPLREALRAWGAAGPQPPADDGAGAAEAEPPGERLLCAGSLRESCGDDPGLIAEVLGATLEGTPGRLDRLEAAIAAGDGRQVSWEAHGLKGTFLTIGAETLAAACQELMTLGERGDLAAVEAAYRPVRNQWDRLKDEATRYLATLPAAGNGTP
jgi:PAS domain S-box-containing protein